MIRLPKAVAGAYRYQVLLRDMNALRPFDLQSDIDAVARRNGERVPVAKLSYVLGKSLGGKLSSHSWLKRCTATGL